MLKKTNLLYSFLIFLSITLASCSQPEVSPPSVEPILKAYIDILHKGNLEEAKNFYFIPLHWRHQQKIYKHFSQQNKLLTEKKLSLKPLTLKQKGRWAVAAMENNEEGVKTVKPLWFFYYDKRWQVVSPIIFKTGLVRSMIDLHREQKELRTWYYQNYPSSKKAQT